MMELSCICPVCGKVGLPDYRIADIRCPACDTDLKAYRLLNAIEKKQKSKLNLFLFAIPCLLFIFSILFIVNRESHFRKMQHQYNERITLINDSIALLKNGKIITVDNEPVVEPDTALVYTIRKGDSFCLISRKIYGTEKYARSIAETNHMKLSSKLFPGNELLIPLK